MTIPAPTPETSPRQRRFAPGKDARPAPNPGHRSAAERGIMDVDPPDVDWRKTYIIIRKLESEAKPPQGPPSEDRASAIELDQYYTKEEVAASLYKVVKELLGTNGYVFLEPSAGTGSFFRLLPSGSIGCDREPKYPGIIEADFLKLEIMSNGKICVIGNPPFGEGARMAVRFFKHAAQWATVIAFIVPRSFRKDSIQKQLNSRFHLVYDVDVEPDAFVFEGKSYDVSTTFQIWERHPEPRELPQLEYRHPDFEIMRKNQGSHFTIQRIGTKAGTVRRDVNRGKSSHYFIHVNAHRDPAHVESIMRQLQLEFADKASNSAGYPSLAIPEIISAYRAFLERNAETFDRCSLTAAPASPTELYSGSRPLL